MRNRPYSEREEALIVRLYNERKTTPEINKHLPDRSLGSLKWKLSNLRSLGRIGPSLAQNKQSMALKLAGHWRAPAPISLPLGDFKSG